MTEVDVPTEIGYGKVVGRFVKFTADTLDPGSTPNEVPLSGSVLIAPLTQIMRWPMVDPPRLAVAVPLDCPVVDGDLCAPGSSVPGVFLVATDQPWAQPMIIQWRATFHLDGVTTQPMSVVFDVPTGGVVDLALVVPVPPEPPSVIVVSTASAEGAAASAVEAELAAMQAEAANTSAQAAAVSANTSKNAATASAVAASDSATAAAGSVSAVTAAKTAAETAAAGAQTSQTAAANSAFAAAGSATAAAGSVTTATNAATAAQTAKTGAETAQTGAQAAQNGAQTAQTAAAGSATAAAGSETAAAGSASSAATNAAMLAQGKAVLVLSATAPVPGGTPTGTVILRTAT